jgi:hypothetical protein
MMMNGTQLTLNFNAFWLGQNNSVLPDKFFRISWGKLVHKEWKQKSNTLSLIRTLVSHRQIEF